MQRFYVIVFFLVTVVLNAQVLVINELDPDSPSTDTAEFIELKSLVPQFSTDGYILVFFNGSSSGGDASYLVIDLNGYHTDNNGLLVIGASGVAPYPQVVISENSIQNGADAVAIYQALPSDFPEGTLATQLNLIDALVYGTNDSADSELLALLGETNQYNDDGTTANPKSIQRFLDAMDNESYTTATPTPRRPNDGNGIPINPISISVAQTEIGEGAVFDILFTAEAVLSSNLDFSISLNNGGFNTSDYLGEVNLTMPSGANTTSTTITVINDIEDEGDEVIRIQFIDLEEPVVPNNNNVTVRVVDDDFSTAPWGTPLSPTYNQVTSTQPNGYYDSLDGLTDLELRQALQDIIANPLVVRAQTYADVLDILIEADENPENSNQVWLLYSEEGRAKLDVQTSSDNSGKWNREHTFPRSRGGFNSIEADDIADGMSVFWTTEADSLRHANSDAHGLRAADAAENSARGNQHYGEYIGPSGSLGSFRGDVARSVLYLAVRYNGLEVVNGFPNTVGQLGDLVTLLDWHRDDPPDDYEMNRNNVVYQWQQNRNPFIDQPLLVEYIWGDNVGEVWNQSLSIADDMKSDVFVYPNPAKDMVYISGLPSNTTIELYGIEGKLVGLYSYQIQPLQIDLSAGLYIMKIKVGNNKIISRKLMIEN